MQITVEEIRKLRETLNENRIEHEALVTQARILREHCQEIRQLCSQTSSKMVAMVQS